MPLTEHEQRALEQIERDFHIDDPAFADSYRCTEPRNYHGRRLRRCSLLLLVGLGLLLTGVAIHPTGVGTGVAVGGFILMVAALTGAVASCRSLCRPLIDHLATLPRSATRRGKQASPP